MSEAQAKSQIEAYFSGEWSRLTRQPTAALYHYTRNSEVILDIIRSGRLRAYCVDYMNDYTELRYAASIMRAHLDRAYAREPTNEVASAFKAAQELMRGPIITRNVFVLSYTTDADDVGMWRLYSDRGKGASFACPMAGLVEFTVKHRGIIASVVYDPEALDAFCARALFRFREICIEAAKTGQGSDPNVLAGHFLDTARWFAPVFKPRVYADENEWRIVFLRTDGHLRDERQRHYIEIVDPPIDAVCLGPACEISNGEFQQGLLASGFRKGHFRSNLDLTDVARPVREQS